MGRPGTFLSLFLDEARLPTTTTSKPVPDSSCTQQHTPALGIGTCWPSAKDTPVSLTRSLQDCSQSAHVASSCRTTQCPHLPLTKP